MKNFREYKLFAICKVREFNDEWEDTDSYVYSKFSSEILDLPPEQLEKFLYRTIRCLTDRHQLIKTWRSTPITVLEELLDPKIYKLIAHEEYGVKNIYELRRSIHKYHDGSISSKIPGIAKVKGTKVLEAAEKLFPAFGKSVYTERWEKDEEV